MNRRRSRNRVPSLDGLACYNFVLNKFKVTRLLAVAFSYRKTVSAVLLVFVVMANVLLPAPPANASHKESRGTTTVDSRELDRRGGPWYRGEGGKTGDDGYWYTYRSDSRAYWNFGDLRGVFRAELHYPHRDAHKWNTCNWLGLNCVPRPPTASPRIQIQQRNSNGSWVTIRDFRSSVLDSNRKYKTGWWGWNNVELDGEVRVRIRKRFSDDKYRLAADKFRFIWKAYHSDDIETAVSACKESIATLYDTGRWSASGLASLNPVTGLIAWAAEGLLRDVIGDNKDSLVADCSRRFRENQSLWLGPFPLKAGFFLSANHNGRSARGVVYT